MIDNERGTNNGNGLKRTLAPSKQGVPLSYHSRSASPPHSCQSFKQAPTHEPEQITPLQGPRRLVEGSRGVGE